MLCRQNSFNFQYIDLLFPEQKSIRHERHCAIKCIANTKQQGNACKRRSPHICCVKDECDAVIDRVCNDRFKQHIVRFAQSIEGGVEHILNGVEHVEANKVQHEAEQLIYIRESKHVGHKRLPNGNAYKPQSRDDRRDSEIAEQVSAAVL